MYTSPASNWCTSANFAIYQPTHLLVFICTYLSEEGVCTSLFSCQLLPRIEQKVRLRHRDFASRGVIDRELRAEDFYKQGVIDKDTRQCLSNFSSVSLSVHLLVCPRGSRPACMTCLRAGQSVIIFVCVLLICLICLCVYLCAFLLAMRLTRGMTLEYIHHCLSPSLSATWLAPQLFVCVFSAHV